MAGQEEKKYQGLSNMLDFNYSYDFENDAITTVGKKLAPPITV